MDYSAVKIGRNQPCPCNSGLKYKRCCGSLSKADSTEAAHIFRHAPSKEAVFALRRHRANELIRKQQQGLGKPIISFKYRDQQIVAAGNTIYHSPKWKTFPDFLSDYLKMTLGPEWGNSEIAKPLEQRHPILQWYEEYCHFQKRHDFSGEIKTAPPTGVVYCYLGLSYSLYLIKHNVELQERLLKRLKDRAQFQGAYFELVVANSLIRAGFELILEDETDGASKHCEFSAVSEKTGKKYWVEAKMRGVAGLLGKTSHDGTKNVDATSELVKHLNGAFAKPAEDQRLIFIDLNTEPLTSAVPAWAEKAGQRLEKYEQKQLSQGQSAYVLISNISFHRTLQSEDLKHVVMAHGLGNDFWSASPTRLGDIYRRKQKHIDVHSIIAALGKYPQLPTTFDGSLPSEAFDKKAERVVIGEKYFFEGIDEKGVMGTVTTATIAEHEKKMYVGILADDGTNQILTLPISDATLSDYKDHPDAFFGQIRSAPKKCEDPYELFEFFLEAYRQTPKEKLLEFMKGAPDIEDLSKLEQMDLAIEYCERCVAGAMRTTKRPG